MSKMTSENLHGPQEETIEQEVDESERGPEWGSPAGLSEFADVVEPSEPKREPGPNDCAR
jgi:hypothetical protein